MRVLPQGATGKDLFWFIVGIIATIQVLFWVGFFQWFPAMIEWAAANFPFGTPPVGP